MHFLDERRVDGIVPQEVKLALLRLNLISLFHLFSLDNQLHGGVYHLLLRLLLFDMPSEVLRHQFEDLLLYILLMIALILY
jgi:hypothetical protein